jgi:hypothetical protein
VQLKGEKAPKNGVESEIQGRLDEYVFQVCCRSTRFANEQDFHEWSTIVDPSSAS